MVVAKSKKAIRRKPSGKLERQKEAKYYETDLKKRQKTRQFYRKLDKTMEWAENNYYHLPIESQNASLITVNAFWRDYADHQPGGDKPYRSVNFAEASHSFPEMMFALAMLDLPFESAEHQTKF